MLKADFHIHTEYSRCSNLKPKDIISQAKIKGLDVIGVVDHGNIKGGLLVKKIAGRKLTVIPGEEIKTNCGDLIIFNSDGKYSRDLIEICERAKQLNHFIYTPHPFDITRHSLDKNLKTIKKYINAVEIFNSRCYVNKFNEKAKMFAAKNKLVGLCGSDAHFKNEIGKSINYIYSTKFNLNKIKISGTNCKYSPIHVHLKSSIERFFKS
ncbi:MAG: PHP domain-containing protein [Nanoarchaeota archaeon]|nr:PHP domain-containing protein [Nanoarchaeota archaeon]MBU4124496.1 PHP domain-containing protein [Nanoarchaeota archaeon]